MNETATATEVGLTVRAYRGDEAVLLAFDLDQAKAEHLAGFAIKCTPPGGQPFYIPNRLSFSTPVTANSVPATRPTTPSNTAPIQKFRWLHIPTNIQTGTYTYEVCAMYFTGSGDGTNLQAGSSTTVSIDIVPPNPIFPHFNLGFTRGAISSQAYVDEFGNAPIEPSPRTIDFDTSPYEKQYEWLGFNARSLVFDVLHECVNDPSCTVDVFAYDLDEPDVIRCFIQLGNRLRIVLDDAQLHTKPGAMEISARQALQQSAGADHVVSGHFSRFAHDKVIIQKRNGNPVKVLTGSANFSLRGLYVQSNNVMVFDDAQAASLYEQAFEQAFTAMSKFTSSPIASHWYDLTGDGIPKTSVSFAPHQTANVSLDYVSQAIKNAKSSVLFAVMELGGGGSVLQDLQSLSQRPDILWYGMTQSTTGLNVIAPGQPNGILAPFAFLAKQVPAPFKQEWSGGLGQVIHHKFVVCDFNSSNPIVFAGSSNLAAGGEQQNGDNLLAISDQIVATMYAVEAVKLVDHYHFRAVLQKATSSQPLCLQPDSAQWWAPYYDGSHLKCRDRVLFAEGS